MIDLRQCTFPDSTFFGAILATGPGDFSQEPAVSVVLPEHLLKFYRALSVIGLARPEIPLALSIEAALGGARDGKLFLSSTRIVAVTRWGRAGTDLDPTRPTRFPGASCYRT